MATLKDVAAKAELTVGTVSRVLNNRGYISEETREKVYRVMKELNYQPNELARSLSKQKTNIIGVIVPHIVHPYFAKLISSIESEASGQGYRIMLCNSHLETEKELDYIEMFKAIRVTGVIICSGSVDVAKFSDLNIPLVTIERDLGAGNAIVECDNYQGGVLAANHLIECGCRRLLNFAGVQNSSMPADERSTGFARVCADKKVFCAQVLSTEDAYNNLEYAAFIEKEISSHPGTDGIFASSDVIAAQVLQVCLKMGIRVPEDMKVVGFDDSSIAKMTAPQITTIRQPIKEMAEQAVYIILKLSRNEIVPTKVTLPVTLVKRETT